MFAVFVRVRACLCVRVCVCIGSIVVFREETSSGCLEVPAAWVRMFVSMCCKRDAARPGVVTLAGALPALFVFAFVQGGCLTYS